LIRSVSTATAALSNVSSVFQLFSFLAVCSGMISKVFGFVAFFASAFLPLQFFAFVRLNQSNFLTNIKM
jgi:hypothetical protein